MEAIAVVGLSARLPQDAVSTEAFWELIREGRRATTEIPSDRMNVQAFYHPNADRSDTTNVRKGHFLKGNIGAFDASFFSIKPEEAESMDPQQRILLELSYTALENAGITMESAVGSKTAVFYAASTRDYEVMLYRDPELTPKYMGTGIGTSLLANRVSWFFDFKGPSVTIDTACSGSLTAVHLACQSLRNRESSQALVGGGALILTPEVSMSQLSTLGFLSPDGRSYSFDYRANGYAKGEGLGIVVLKRVDDAIRDGDTIRAIIRSTAINQDGRTPGITQPSKTAQTANIIQAYAAADLSLEQTTYFEAHGTGTKVGDPIEAEAIHMAFQRKPDNPLYIGALKANIGHLEAGAGIAALIKSVLMLEHGVLPPNADFKGHNPAIPIDEWNLKFINSATLFPSKDLRRISINSFGYGGSNAHAILDDALSYLKGIDLTGKHTTIAVPPSPQPGVQLAPSTKTTESSKSTNDKSHNLHEYKELDRIQIQPTVLVISAADEPGIIRLVNAYESYFTKLCELDHLAETDYLANVAYTLSNRRSNLPWKVYSVVKTLSQLRAGFANTISKPQRAFTSPSISYVFNGQGSQWYAMAQGLTNYPAFRKSIQASQAYLAAFGCKWILMNELHKTKKFSRVDEPELSQPLCTILQIALIDLLASWGIFPAAVCGHSSGEIAAAYSIGALSHESAIKVAYFRGRAATGNQWKRSGSMMAVNLSEIDIGPYLDEAMQEAGGRISVGCVNGSENITITGDNPAMEALQRKMSEIGIFARKLKVSVAYHSYHMEDLALEYLGNIRSISSGTEDWGLRVSAIMFSSVTGERTTAEEVGGPDYWVKNLVNKVRFSESISRMIAYLLASRESSNRSGRDILLEIGPHSALQRPIKDTVKDIVEAKNFDYNTVLTREIDPLISLAHIAGRLRCHGCVIDLAKVSSPNKSTTELQSLTDLPAYQFNHSRSYWVESRISKSFRFREFPRHELLGVRETDWNPQLPKFRNVIRLAEHPWIRDHKFRGTCLYPAAGMLVMAIEGARQLTCAEANISGFRLRDIRFPGAFVVPLESKTIEAHLHLYPCKAGFAKSQSSYSFQINAYVNHNWIETCSGLIAVERFDTELSATKSCLNELKRTSLGELLQKGFAKRWEKVSSSQFYESLAACEYQLGSTFQTLSDLRFTEDGQATARVVLDDWKMKTEKFTQITRHVIHPTDLDGILQSSVEAYSQGGRVQVPVLIPTRLKSLWISSGLLEREAGQDLQILTKTTFRGFRETDFSIGAIDNKNRVSILIHGFRQTALNDQATENLQFRRSCYFVDWKPDVELISHFEAKQLCEKSVNPATVPSVELVDRQELLCLYYMEKAIREIPEGRVEYMPSHLKRYMRWIQHQYKRDELERLRLAHPENDKLFGDEVSHERFLSKFSAESGEGKLIVETGKHFLSVLRGERDALELFFGGDDLLNQYYSSAPFKPSFRRLNTYIDLLAHKNPALDILEIGAGTGSATESVLECLTHFTDRVDGRSDIPRFRNYTFTDISSGFFEEGKERFRQHANRMTYSVLNIEKDPTEQGYPREQFDIIIASLVLHATSNIKETLKNVRRVLKPGGKLLLLEPTAPKTARVSFVFGLLPGWWLGVEEKREFGPLLEDDDWHELLLENGFSGVDIRLPDQTDLARHTFSGLISTAVESCPPKATVSESIIIVATQRSPLQQRVACDVQSALSNGGSVSLIVSPAQCVAQQLRNNHCISLLEIDQSFFKSVSETEWAWFKEAYATPRSMLWITRGCTIFSEVPDLAIVKGLGRAIRCENLDARFVELALEAKTTAEQATKQIVKVFRTTILPHKEFLESELMEHFGQLCIGRLVEAQAVNTKIYQTTTYRQAVVQPFAADAGRRLNLIIQTPGLLKSLCFDDEVFHEEPLAPTEVEIEVKAVGLNEKDLLIAQGHLPGNVLGSECAGIVTRAGAQSDHKPGDRVCCYTTSGAFKTYVRSNAKAVINFPDNMSFEEAAGMPVSYATVYYSLVTVANLQEGETVLVYSGAGAIGQAAIQLAQRIGARIFTTVDSAKQKDLLKDRYGVPYNQILFNGDPELSENIMSMTHSGVDVVFDLLGDPTSIALWSCVASLGRFVELGYANTQPARRDLPMELLERNISFKLVDIGIVMDKAEGLMARIMKAVSKLLTNSNPITVPQPLHVYQVDEIEKAFLLMASGKNDRKVVVRIGKDDRVPVLPTLRPSYYFDSNATYVIAGGLGGLGRSIVAWMVTRRARHFLLLSRSGAEGNEVACDLISEMQDHGVFIAAPRCDITDEQSVIAALKDASETMPPIKGCIQGSMVLKDGLLESTSAADLHAVLRPKTLGSQYLHRHLPPNLSFFVLLSSIAGMTGSRGQANYAAANTYQDALARHLCSRRSPCLSLNLGSIMSVGFAAEHNLTAALRRDGFEGVSKATFFALLDYACDPNCAAARDPHTAQLVTGLGAAETLPADHFRSVYWTSKPMFRPLLQLNAVTQGSAATAPPADGAETNFAIQIASAADVAAAKEAVLGALVDRLARLLAVPREEIDVRRAILTFGIDSLIALELRQWVLKELRAEISVFDIMQAADVEGLAGIVTRRTKLR